MSGPRRSTRCFTAGLPPPGLDSPSGSWPAPAARRLRAPGTLMTAIVFWNLGVAIGLTCYFPGLGHRRRAARISRLRRVSSSGSPTPSSALDHRLLSRTPPRPRSDRRRRGSWSRCFAFPWLWPAAAFCSAAHRLPGSNVIQGLLDAWYVHGIYTLWLAPLGLGALYYLIPKVSGLPLRFAGQSKTGVLDLDRLRALDRRARSRRRPVPCGDGHARADPERPDFPARRADRHEPDFDSFSRRGKADTAASSCRSSLSPRPCSSSRACSEQILSIRSANELLHFTMFREANTVPLDLRLLQLHHFRRDLLHRAAADQFRLALLAADPHSLLRQSLRHPACHRHARLRRRHAGLRSGKSRPAGDHLHGRADRRFIPHRRHDVPEPRSPSATASSPCISAGRSSTGCDKRVRSNRLAAELLQRTVRRSGTDADRRGR